MPILKINIFTLFVNHHHHHHHDMTLRRWATLRPICPHFCCLINIPISLSTFLLFFFVKFSIIRRSLLRGIPFTCFVQLVSTVNKPLVQSYRSNESLQIKVNRELIFSSAQVILKSFNTYCLFYNLSNYNVNFSNYFISTATMFHLM